MKTTTIYLMLFLFTVLASNAGAQNFSDMKFSETLPKDLQLKEEVQTYLVTTDHFNGDIYGNFFNKFRVQGEYTRGLDNGKVKWNNVTVAMGMQRDADFQPGTKLNYMENYSYVPSPEMLKPDNFTTFTEHSAYAKNLIWDMMGIEGFAWAFWNELELNKPYVAENFNKKMDLAGQGFFENKNIVLTWTGVSNYNNEPCATIQYQTLNNPVEYAEESMSMKGRSHYWGTIWISLEDKQIEHASLFEDVTADIQLPGQTNSQIMNIVREISFEKRINTSF